MGETASYTKEVSSNIKINILVFNSFYNVNNFFSLQSYIFSLPKTT